MKRRFATFHARALISALLVSSASTSARAQETNAAPSEPPATAEQGGTSTPAPAKPWSGPDTSDGFDWIELTSGEWLKGEIKDMYDDRLRFDSDKLDLLTLDWEDVHQVITDNTQTVRTDDNKRYSGALHIDENQVRVTSTEGATTTFDRADLLALVEGAPKEINYWSFKLGAGITYQTGNTKQTDVNINAKIQRRTAGNRLTLDYLGIATTTDDVETANNHRANGSFDVFVTRRLFLRTVFGEYYKDTFQNIEHQGTVGAGIGYTLIDNSRTEWDVFAGPAYRYTRFVSVQPGESLEDSTPALAAGTTWETELTSWIDADAVYRFNILDERSGTYTHHATAGLSIELTSVLDLDFSVVWDRIQTPQERADGTTPLQDDFRILFGVSVDL